MSGITTTQDFQERLFERIRDQMGDLLTDEDLKRITAAAVEKALFSPPMRTVYGGRQEPDGEARFVTLVRGAVKERAEVAIDAWIKDNGDKIAAAVQESLAKGMTGMILSYIDAKTYGPLMTLQNELRDKGILT